MTLSLTLSLPFGRGQGWGEERFSLLALPSVKNLFVDYQQLT